MAERTIVTRPRYPYVTVRNLLLCLQSLHLTLIELLINNHLPGGAYGFSTVCLKSEMVNPNIKLSFFPHFSRTNNQSCPSVAVLHFYLTVKCVFTQNLSQKNRGYFMCLGQVKYHEVLTSVHGKISCSECSKCA